MAIEAVSFKRLSDSNFASGWIPLIYDGKESQSVAVSPEMPWQVNCILSLLTNSKDLCARTHARRIEALAFPLGWQSSFFFFFIQPKTILQVNRSKQLLELESRSGSTVEEPSRTRARVPTSRMTGWLSTKETSDTEIRLLPPNRTCRPPDVHFGSLKCDLTPSSLLNI